jgi:hypothetical protein
MKPRARIPVKKIFSQQLKRANLGTGDIDGDAIAQVF